MNHNQCYEKYEEELAERVDYLAFQTASFLDVFSERSVL